MCGIAGILKFDGAPADVAGINALNTALSHRGRDSAAVQAGSELSAYPGIALGHRRLSVIDLSNQASQPMRSRETGATIVYNGELYNYREIRRELEAGGFRFYTDSDTEVVLVAYDAWGEKCLERFNGMFAFAIWDEARRCLFCARDPLGIKPFYYMLGNGEFIFASESQALARLRGCGLDRHAVACYFMSMYVPRQLSIYEGIKKLLPGCSLRVGIDGASQVRRYWAVPGPSGRHPDRAEAVAELTGILDGAVKAQLRSDVPVGALLSGGFDSGMIVASAGRASIPLHTYSVGFDDGRQASELPVARAMAERYGTIHHERVIAGGEVLGLLDNAVAAMSEPVADSAVVPTYCLSGMAAEDGVKVLLSGTGGDEVFAGYSRYIPSSARRRALLALPRGLRHALGGFLSQSQPVLGARLSHPAIDMMVYAGGAPLVARHLFSDGSDLRRFLDDLAGNVFPPAPAGPVGLYEHMGFDLEVYLPDLLLLLLDQLTMAHTVEGRVPLLDTDLIAASYALPPDMHATAGRAETRGLMRDMAVDRIDPRTFSARKMGFSGPVEAWLADNRTTFRDGVMAARECSLLADMPLESLWREGEKTGGRPWAMSMFAVYCFAKWYDTHAG